LDPATPYTAVSALARAVANRQDISSSVTGGQKASIVGVFSEGGEMIEEKT
jgi:hypothetical protein